MNSILAVAAGGAIGSVGRYLAVAWIARRFGADFPWGTLAVNAAGGLAIGLLAGVFGLLLQISAEIRLFLVTGLLGGFTTFSAFSLEVVELCERGAWAAAAGYVAASVALSVSAAFAGLWLARSFA